MIRNRNILTMSSFTAMFFLGVGSAIIGAASRNIGLSPFQIGLLLATQNIGFILSVITVGTLADSADKARLLFAASLIIAVSFFFFYLKDSFILNLGIMLIIGVGIGGYEGAADAMLLDIHKRRESLFISVNHFFVTFGELMMVIYLIFLQMDWRKSMVQSAVAVFVLAIIFGLSRVPPRKVVTESFRKRLAFIGKQRPVLVLFLMASCAVGIELSLIGIITTLLMEFYGFDQVSSKLGLVGFLAGIAAGRIVLGVLARKSQLLKYILALFALTSVVLSFLLFASPGTVMAYILLVVSGATISVIFPLIIALAGLKYLEMSGMVMGIIKLGIPVGGIVVPLMLSLFVQAASFKAALVLFPAIGIAGFILALTHRKQLAIVSGSDASVNL
ncbi:MAG: MFS transporter [Deltaproteobacteria bacterium]|nr:MFS transporter [Deltaproteobacteria bacterium]